MTQTTDSDSQAFGRLFRTFLEQTTAQAPQETNPFPLRLRGHFSAEPAQLPTVAEAFRSSDHPNVQLALEAYLSQKERAAEIIGVTGEHSYFGLSFSQLLGGTSAAFSSGSGFQIGPVEHVAVDVGGDVLTCIQTGLLLISSPKEKLAVLMTGPSAQSMRQQVRLEVMAANRETAERFLAEIRLLARQRNVYRGRVISLGVDDWNQIRVRFHTLTEVDRSQIVLPEGLLDRIERQTVRFSQHREKLLRAGRHLRRGILLYGPPGTGKTFTAMHLAHRMKERTVLLLTGRGVGLIEHSCEVARLLQPATVILEDVDLVAEERTHSQGGCSVLLFELLNQMDGLADDADILFLLTTNRPELLEPALAARPGRIDLAIEVPLPDAACRRRLFELYSKGLSLRVDQTEDIVRRTEGVSAAFIRELLRKAALFAAEEDGEIVVRDRHLQEALEELVINGGELTKKILGARVQT